MMTSSVSSLYGFEYCLLYSFLGEGGSDSRFYGQYIWNESCTHFLGYSSLDKKAFQDRRSNVKVTGFTKWP